MLRPMKECTKEDFLGYETQFHKLTFHRNLRCPSGWWHQRWPLGKQVLTSSFNTPADYRKEVRHEVSGFVHLTDKCTTDCTQETIELLPHREDCYRASARAVPDSEVIRKISEFAW